MSDLISRSKLIGVLKDWGNSSDMFKYDTAYDVVQDCICHVENQPLGKADSQWIPCSKRLPEEHDSIFKKAKGTDKWRSGMFESISGDVNVTVEFEDGTRTTKTSHTLDGEWKCEKEYGIKMKVIAWQPLPEPYKGEIENDES